MSQSETVNEAPPEYPAWWDWQEDGSPVEGIFLRVDTGYTEQGERPFVVLNVKGEERTLWLLNEVLRNQFAREVYRRASKQIEVGERVTVWRLGEVEGGNGRSYINFRAEFLDGPVRTQADIFAPSLGKAEPEGSLRNEEPEGDSAEQGIPF